MFTLTATHTVAESDPGGGKQHTFLPAPALALSLTQKVAVFSIDDGMINVNDDMMKTDITFFAF